MNDKSRLHVTRERHFSAHHILLGAARAAFETAEHQQPGWFYGALNSMTMSALAIEAIANAFGSRVVDDWSDFESSSPTAKLRIICKELGVSYNQNKEPWSTAKWLSRFRNHIAHARPELVNKKYVWTKDEYEKRHMEQPQSKLETEITIGNARRALSRVEEIKEILCAKVPAENSLGLYADSWFGSASVANE